MEKNISPMRIRKLLLLAMQCLITFGLLWWIFRDPAKNANMVIALRQADIGWFVPAFLCIGCASLIQAQRWTILLQVQEIRLGFWRTYRLVLIGVFFNLFLLGSTGGDVMKIFYAMREAGTKKTAAFLSVLIDRMVGLLALVAVTAVICFFSFRELTASPVVVALLYTMGGILVGSVGVVACGLIVERLQWAQKIPRWFPLRKQILEMASAFSIYARDPLSCFAAFVISLPAHILFFTSFFFVAKAFTSTLTLGNIVTAMPVISTITALPISLAGMGVREGLFETMLGTLFGTPRDVAILISLGGFFVTLVWGLIGGALYLFYRPTGLDRDQIASEVATVEGTLEN